MQTRSANLPQRDITNFNIDNKVLLDSCDGRMIVCKYRFHKLSSWWAGIIFHQKLGDHGQSLIVLCKSVSVKGKS